MAGLLDPGGNLLPQKEKATGAEVNAQEKWQIMEFEILSFNLVHNNRQVYIEQKKMQGCKRILLQDCKIGSI